MGGQILSRLLMQMDMEGRIGTIIAILFFGWMFGYAVYQMIKEYRNCKMPVQAVCVELLRKRNSGKTLFAPVWEYEHNGQRIRSSGAATNVFVPKVGKTRTVYIDPQNPQHYRGWVSVWLIFVVLLGAVLVFLFRLLFAS